MATMPPQPPQLSSFKLLIHDATNLETRSATGVTSALATPTFAVHAAVTDGEGNALAGSGKKWSKTTKNDIVGGKEKEKNKKDGNKGDGEDKDPIVCRWDATLELDTSGADVDSKVEIVLYRAYGHKKVRTPSEEVGRTVTTVRELAEMDDAGGDGAEMFLFDSNGDVVLGGRYLPVVLRVSVGDRTGLPEELQRRSPKREATQQRSAYAKHAMMITRGTRGDIQPFVALARGLAELRNWEVTIVTENEFKGFVNSQSTVRAGAIHWRPSGGDTMKRVQAPLSQKAINLKISAKQTNAMQRIFLARSECEFFPSEPAVYYWADKLKPDYLVFGLTMVSIAMIASEALRIPLLGFVLQPTIIPSDEYPPVLPLKEESVKRLLEDEDMMTKRHEHFILLKYLMERIPTFEGLGTSNHGHGLDSLRARRGLDKYVSYETNAWQELLVGNYPLVVPINEAMFGGKPLDWSENAIFTDCIFLRGDNVPPIAPDAQRFLDGARAMGGKVVVLAFSSMPVSKSQIVSIALKLICECSAKVCVFALVGKQIDLPLDSDVQEEADAAVDDGRLFLAKGSPFGRLFPLVDAVVLHGGLGTTSEALQAQIPAIVTGVLLLDQRFWGSRCAALNVGPFGVHIDDFPDTCVEHVDRAVAADSEWKANAEKIGRLMTEEAKDDPSGVRRNVDAIVRLSEKAVPYRYDKDKDFFQRTVKDGIRAFLKDKVSEHKKERKHSGDYANDDVVYLSFQA